MEKEKARTKPIGYIKKNSRADIQVSLVEYDGWLYCDLRERAASIEGPPVLTAKGIRFPVDHIDNLVNHLLTVKNQVATFLNQKREAENGESSRSELHQQTSQS